MLHTGQGAAGLGLVLGLMALGVPVMGGTGVALWLAGTARTAAHLRATSLPATAGTILLVGSEGGSTWGFAATLHKALTRSRAERAHRAHVGLRSRTAMRSAERIIVLAATYGDGDAPASAKGFLDRLACARPSARAYRLPCSASATAASRPSAPSRRPSRRRPRRRAGRSSCRSTPWTASRRRISRAGAVRSGRRYGH